MIQLTTAPHGHILTNAAVWSHNAQWIVYDIRSDPDGATFDGSRIERIHIDTREIQTLYTSRNGAHCGVVTCSPLDDRVVFIHGPDDPTDYRAYHRRGVIVDGGRLINVDACDVVPPFTPGALRGGSHVHTFSRDGTMIAFTYEDHILATLREPGDFNQRNVGVSIANHPIAVPSHPRNHDGTHFSVLVTNTVNEPTPGSDEISKAFEESWIGSTRSLAFQGHVVTASGETIAEVFVVNLPDNLTLAGDGPLEGTPTQRPFPPKGTHQRRLTFTADRQFPGLRGPRHWLRSSFDGQRIAFLMCDDDGVSQLWTISPNGGTPRQLTHNSHPIASAFTWSPDDRWIAHVMDHSVCITNSESGETTRITPRTDDAPRPEACVFSPDGERIAFVRNSGGWNQVFFVTLGE